MAAALEYAGCPPHSHTHTHHHHTQQRHALHKNTPPAAEAVRAAHTLALRPLNVHCLPTDLTAFPPTFHCLSTDLSLPFVQVRHQVRLRCRSALVHARRRDSARHLAVDLGWPAEPSSYCKALVARGGEEKTVRCVGVWRRSSRAARPKKLYKRKTLLFTHLGSPRPLPPPPHPPPFATRDTIAATSSAAAFRNERRPQRDDGPGCG